MGASKGLVGEPMFVPEVHGADGVGNANFPGAEKVRPLDTSAAEFIVEQSREHPDEISVIALGPLTNVALAMRLDPDLPERISKIVWMGGAVYAPGNITATAEFDAWGDPEAAQMVLQASWPVQMVSLDVTDVPVFFQDDVEILRQASTPASNYMATVMPFYMQFYLDRYGEYSCAAHSALTVAVVAQPDIVTSTESLKIQVETDGAITRGMTVADRRPVGHKGDDPGWDTTPMTELPRSVDMEKFRDLFIARMCEEL